MEKPNSLTQLLVNESPLPLTASDGGATNTVMENFSLVCVSQNLIKEVFLEFIGTYIMLMFGIGSVAQMKLNNDNGGSLSVHISWSLGVVFGFYVSDGGHLNSAITIANFLFGGFPLKKMFLYLAAQFLAGFLAAGSVYGIYFDSFRGYGFLRADGNHMIVPDTAGIFCTFPFSYTDYRQNVKTLGLGFSCLSEFAATFILYFLCLSFTDEKKKNPSSNLTGFFIGLVVLGIGCAYGQQTGYALNPARDFPPRLFIYAMGWGNELFTYGNYYFWVPVLMPILGAIVAGFFYETMIREKNNMKSKIKV